VSAIVRHMPGHYNPFNVVLATRHADGSSSIDPNVSLVTAVPKPVSSPRLVLEDVVRDDNPLRHDSEKLATALLRVYEEQRRIRNANGAVRAR